jgi:hypothetical protein
MSEIVTPGPGVYPGVAADTYHAWNCASNSRLSRLLRSPAHLDAYLKEPSPETKSLIIGRAAHVAILEPDSFEARYTFAEQCQATIASGENKGKRCSNDGVWIHAQLGWVCGVHAKSRPAEDLSVPRCVLAKSDYDTTLRIRDAVNAHPSARGIVQAPGDAELSLVWDDPGTGVRCKGRFDWYKPVLAGGTITDVKTTTDASPDAFERSLFKWGYHRQSAMYLMGARALGLEARHYAIIAVEKTPPFAVAVYRFGEESLGSLEPPQQWEKDYGAAGQLRSLLRRYESCMTSGVFPGYGDDVRDLSVPSWAWSVMDSQTRDLDHALEEEAA